MTRFLAFFLIIGACAAMAEEGGWKLPAKYQRVVDRFPFGEPPPGFDPMSTTAMERGGASVGQDEAAPEIPLTQQQEALQKVVVATALVFDRISGRPWLGFSDTTDPKAPKAHYVELGATEDGWRVVDIDMAKKTAKLSKGEVEIEVTVGAQPERPSGGDARRGGLAARRQASSATPGRSPLLSRNAPPAPAPVPPSTGSAPTSMASLRQQRLARETAQRQQLEAEHKARLAAAEEAQRKQEEDDRRRAQERAEREAEREAERAEYNQRVKNLAAALEEQMAANRKKSESEEEEDDD